MIDRGHALSAMASGRLNTWCGLARLKPFARDGSLALRAVPIAATIISHMPVAAGGVLAKGDITAKRCCAAALDG